MSAFRTLSGVAAGATALVATETLFRALEPTLPTHRLWYDTLPAIRVQQMRRMRSADVVFSGHSMVHCGIRPSAVLEAAGLAHVRGYNAGLHRGFYGVVGPFLLDAVIPLLRPAVVVLGASIFDLNDNGVLITETAAKYTEALLGRQDAMGRVARAAAFRSAVFRNKGAVRHPRRIVDALAGRVTGRAIRDEDVRDSRHNVGEGGEWLGYADRGFHTTANMRRHLIDDGLGGYTAGGAQLDQMKAWIERIRAAGPQVVLMAMRPSDALWREIANGDQRRAEMSELLRKLAADVGVEILEPEAALVDEDHYADLAHLNGVGREVFSAAVGRCLGAAARDGRISLA